MRKTRNRQFAKIPGSFKWQMTIPTRDISKYHDYNDCLDKTFKWHRELVNRVEFDIKAGSIKGTVLLPVKWKEYSK